MRKRFGGSEETRDPSGCIMHIAFQEVHNIFKSREWALEPPPVWTDSFGIQMLLTPNKMLLHRHACFTKLPWKLPSQCHGLWCGTGLPYTPDIIISWFRTFHWCPNELIQNIPLGSDCVHTETRMGSECDHEQARSIANERDSQEISTFRVLNDWTYELQSDTSRRKIIIINEVFQ